MTGGHEASDATGALLREEGTARRMAGKVILVAIDVLVTASPRCSATCQSSAQKPGPQELTPMRTAGVAMGELLGLSSAL